jgi:hypothetical protein
LNKKAQKDDDFLLLRVDFRFSRPQQRSKDSINIFWMNENVNSNTTPSGSDFLSLFFPILWSFTSTIFGTHNMCDVECIKIFSRNSLSDFASSSSNEKREMGWRKIRVLPTYMLCVEFDKHLGRASVAFKCHLMAHTKNKSHLRRGEEEEKKWNGSVK